MSMEQRIDSILENLQEISNRVDSLEKERRGDVGDSPTVQRVLEDCRTLHLHSARLKRVPDDYYSRSLEERR